MPCLPCATLAPPSARLLSQVPTRIGRRLTETGLRRLPMLSWHALAELGSEDIDGAGVWRDVSLRMRWCLLQNATQVMSDLASPNCTALNTGYSIPVSRPGIHKQIGTVAISTCSCKCVSALLVRTRICDHKRRAALLRICVHVYALTHAHLAIL